MSLSAALSENCFASTALLAAAVCEAKDSLALSAADFLELSASLALFVATIA